MSFKIHCSRKNIETNMHVRTSFYVVSHDGRFGQYKLVLSKFL